MGVDVDLNMSVRRKNREGYAEFVGELRAAVNEKGYRVVSGSGAQDVFRSGKGCSMGGLIYAPLGRTGRLAVSDDL